MFVCLFLFSSSFFFFLIRVIFDANGWEQYKEFLHFALTSQDINNTAIPLALKEFVEGSLMTSLSSLVDVLKGRAHEWKDVAMLARTHGQPATPTVVGKEVPNTFLHPPSAPPIVFFLFFLSFSLKETDMGVCRKNRGTNTTATRYSVCSQVWRSHRQPECPLHHLPGY